ncbi:hypothetical protein NQZ79_g3601 [Umbelopsis isabellina]|nr:hypothetical protein NQZ79_g3601 [Umbelopsis isabellina]
MYGQQRVKPRYRLLMMGSNWPHLQTPNRNWMQNSVNGTVSHMEYPKSVFTSEVEELPEKPVSKPSFARMCLRVWQIIASVGTFAFQAGASPVAKMDFPYEPALLYYVYGVTSLSLFWGSFQIYVYLTRRYGKGGKVKRAVLCIADLMVTIFVGIGVFFEISKYPCQPGTQNGLCDMLNTGTAFGVSLFVTLATATLWDIFGALGGIRN